ncbi:hypothetical protein KC926_00900 [Candidatus Kaiserbacteria bacterium]|nr:hypothetical protein [Candidatus Kaiserbacteria bacterium]
MEIISALFSDYLQLLNSWWWLLLGGVTMVSTVVYVLRDFDKSLSFLKSLQLTIVGLADFLPGFRNFFPREIRADFRKLWIATGLDSPRLFILILFALSFLMAPLSFLICFGLLVNDYFTFQTKNRR